MRHLAWPGGLHSRRISVASPQVDRSSRKGAKYWGLEGEMPPCNDLVMQVGMSWR